MHRRTDLKVLMIAGAVMVAVCGCAYDKSHERELSEKPEDFKFLVYSRVSGYGYTNTWYVPMSKLMKLPGWNGQGEPPLPVGKAVSVAKVWVASKGLNNAYIHSIDFRSFDFKAPSGPCWVYIIHFYEVAMVGSWTTCVVLPDGSIVEPETTPQTTNIVRYLD